MSERVSLASARRIALAAQGFGRPRPEAAGQRDLSRTVGRLGLHQIDSVNVLVRAHYLPAYSRLGPYDRDLIDRAAWGPRRQRRLFEYWAHEASLLPLDMHPLLRWRMAAAERGKIGWGSLRAYSGERRGEADSVLERIRSEGPLAASDFEEGRGRSGWWEWGDTKRALEWLFWAGLITTATRRGSFERVYDLPERVLPGAILALPTPSESESFRGLVAVAAKALGIAAETELRDYFRLKPEAARGAVAELVEEGFSSPSRSRAGRSPPSFTATPAARAGSAARLCLRRSTPWSGSAAGPKGCSASATGSRSTRPPTSAFTAITPCPS